MKRFPGRDNAGGPALSPLLDAVGQTVDPAPSRGHEQHCSGQRDQPASGHRQAPRDVICSGKQPHLHGLGCAGSARQDRGRTRSVGTPNCHGSHQPLSPHIARKAGPTGVPTGSDTHAGNPRCPSGRGNHRRSSYPTRRIRQRARLSPGRNRDRSGRIAPGHRCRPDHPYRASRRDHAAVPDRPGTASPAPVGYATHRIRHRHCPAFADGGGDCRAGLAGGRVGGRRGRPRLWPGAVVHRDRAADAGRTGPAGKPSGTGWICGAAVSGSGVHPVGCPGAVARRRKHGARPSAMVGCGDRRGNDRCDPDRWAFPDGSDVPCHRWRSHAGSVHGHGAVDRGRHSLPGRGRGVIGLPGCLHGRRSAVRIRIPPRTGSRHRAVRGVAARFFLHLGRHVGGSRIGHDPADDGARRDSGVDVAQDRGGVWHRSSRRA